MAWSLGGWLRTTAVVPAGKLPTCLDTQHLGFMLGVKAI